MGVPGLSERCTRALALAMCALCVCAACAPDATPVPVVGIAAAASPPAVPLQSATAPPVIAYTLFAAVRPAPERGRLMLTEPALLAAVLDALTAPTLNSEVRIAERARPPLPDQRALWANAGYPDGLTLGVYFPPGLPADLGFSPQALFPPGGLLAAVVAESAASASIVVWAVLVECPAAPAECANGSADPVAMPAGWEDAPARALGTYTLSSPPAPADALPTPPVSP
jgi:hypothetical protein